MGAIPMDEETITRPDSAAVPASATVATWDLPQAHPSRRLAILVLRLGALLGLVVGTASGVVAITTGDILPTAVALAVLMGGASAVWQLLRRDGEPTFTLVLWVALLGALLTLAPLATTSGLTAALLIVGVLGVLSIQGRRAVWYAWYVSLVWAAHVAWRMIGSGGADAASGLTWLLQGVALAGGSIAVFQVKDDLLESARRYRDLVDGVPIGLYRTTGEGHIMAANTRLAEMLGYLEPADLLGTDATEFYPSPEARRAVLDDLESGAPEVVFELIRRDGSSIWVRNTGRPVRGPSGAVLYYEGALEDITERTTAEAALQRAEERFRTAFQHAPNGMAMVSPGGHFLQVNRAFCELLGYPESELIHRNWREITPPEEHAESVERVRAMVRGETDSVELDRCTLRADGREVIGRLSLSLIRDQQEQPAYLIAQLADVTAQRELHEHLESLVRAKDQFVATVSHELRTPLTAVVGLARELRDRFDSFTPDETVEFIKLIAEQSDDVAHIVEDLLVAARADMGELRVSPELIVVRREVDTVIADCEHLRAERGAKLGVEGSAVTAWADPIRFRQVIRNLLTNSFRYGGDRVRLELRGGEGESRVLVVDNGDGVPEADREAIFEPYQRAGDGSGAAGSIGLGLSVSRKLARLMGGDLTYRLGEGESTFELTLPSRASAVGP